MPWQASGSVESSVIPSEVEESLIVIQARMNSKRCLDFARHDRAQLFNGQAFHKMKEKHVIPGVARDLINNSRRGSRGSSLRSE
jgi:hypothetical protein